MKNSYECDEKRNKPPYAEVHFALLCANNYARVAWAYTRHAHAKLNERQLIVEFSLYKGTWLIIAIIELTISLPGL